MGHVTHCNYGQGGEPSTVTSAPKAEKSLKAENYRTCGHGGSYFVLAVVIADVVAAVVAAVVIAVAVAFTVAIVVVASPGSRCHH